MGATVEESITVCFRKDAMPCNAGKCALLVKEWSKQKFKLVWSSGKIAFEFFYIVNTILKKDQN